MKKMIRFYRLLKGLPLIRKLGFLLLTLSFITLALNTFRNIRLYGIESLLGNLAQDYFANVSTEFFSIAITILIIDAIYEKRDRESEKQDLALQMGSPDNSFASEAVRKLKIRGWLQDVLSQVDFKEANLNHIDLSGVMIVGTDLRGGSFEEAILVRVKLEGCDLGGANFKKANLTGSVLLNSDLEKANLVHANLKNAILENANLHRANLSNAILVRANMRRANLAWANFQNADMANVILDWANLTASELDGALGLAKKWLLVSSIMTKGAKSEILAGRDLSCSYLAGAYLEKADLSESDLSNADLSKATLQDAYLVSTTLARANLTDVNFLNADLTRANLADADFSNARLENADLTGANLKGAKLTKQQISQAKSSYHAILPDGTISNA